jgi:hypothetical protein
LEVVVEVLVVVEVVVPTTTTQVPFLQHQQLVLI